MFEQTLLFPDDAARAAVIEAAARTLGSLARELGIPEDTLDEMVLDAKGEEAAARNNAGDYPADVDAAASLAAADAASHEDAEQAASAINQAGFDEQLAYLLEGYPSLEQGITALERVIRDAT